MEAHIIEQSLMKSEGKVLLSKVAMGCTTILKQHIIHKNTGHGDRIALLTPETAVGSWLQQLENRKTSSD